MATTIETKLGTCCYRRGSSSHVLMQWRREKARVQIRGRINLEHLNFNRILLQNHVVQQQGCCYHHNHMGVSNSSLKDLVEDGVFTPSWGWKKIVMHTHFWDSMCVGMTKEGSDTSHMSLCCLKIIICARFPAYLDWRSACFLVAASWWHE